MAAFEPMTTHIPEGSKGIAKIKHVVISPDASAFASLRGDYVPPGTYVHLLINGKLYMSDTPMERRTNADFVKYATGDVLVAGLGIGFALLPVLRKPDVRSLTVIELHQDVIDLVEPHLRVAAGEGADKLTVVCGDIFNFKPAKNQRWDVVYFDIWKDKCTDNLPDMTRLHRRFAMRKRYWMGSWSHKELVGRLRRENQERRDRRTLRRIFASPPKGFM